MGIAQALEPSCTVANQTPPHQRNRRSNTIGIGASDQRKFGEQHGLKRWIHLYLKPKTYPLMQKQPSSQFLIGETELNFPVSPKEHETCQALLIVSKMK